LEDQQADETIQLRQVVEMSGGWKCSVSSPMSGFGISGV